MDSDYIIETGISLCALYLALCLLGVMLVSAWCGLWGILFFVPPLLFILVVWKIKIWDGRPSVNRK